MLSSTQINSNQLSDSCPVRTSSCGRQCSSGGEGGPLAAVEGGRVHSLQWRGGGGSTRCSGGEEGGPLAAVQWRDQEEGALAAVEGRRGVHSLQCSGGTRRRVHSLQWRDQEEGALAGPD
ncbi:unnamed protein product [Gadus morhua 'NCC']